ncbi:hypothetical protein FBR02_06730 [Anaerolineae bacterium CFX9]|nr:hypothetical protein [Chloroflexota bacterium]MDL1900448.1 hypothetical protein [Anaerolineae bacterium CFX9]
MRFWQDMQSKWGFSDGDAVPDGIEVYRTIYIRAVNQLAEQLGSSVRAAAYDRFGVHNWCLILIYKLADLQAHGIENFTAHTDINAEIAAADEAMEEAIRQAYELDLDTFAEVTVTLADDFEGFMMQLRPIKEGDPLIAQVNDEAQHFYPGGRIRLVQAVTAFDRSVLPIGSEYVIIWIEHRAELIGVALAAGENPIAFASAASAIVLEIPAEARAKSEDCAAIPPYHLRDMEDEILDQFGQFYSLPEALEGVQRAANVLGTGVHLVNGYGNSVLSCEPD